VTTWVHGTIAYKYDSAMYPHDSEFHISQLENIAHYVKIKNSLAFSCCMASDYR